VWHFSTLSGMLLIEELTVRLDGKYHETLSAEALDATIRATSNKLDPAFAEKPFLYRIL
jgi:hypothetical protein